MILAVDMGNTNIVVGGIDGEKIVFFERISTDGRQTSFEYAMEFKSILDLYHVEASAVEGHIISSVVPQLTDALADALKKLTGKDSIIVGPGIKTGLNILTDDPKGVGADLITVAVAVLEEYGAPAIMIDMGTATTIAVMDQKGNYLGGAVAPGMRASLAALVDNAALLPGISFEKPKKAIGRNTVDAMKSGIVLGNASMLDGIIDRMEEELGYECPVYATGGLSHTVIPLCRHKAVMDDTLLLKGLRVLYEKNR